MNRTYKSIRTIVVVVAVLASAGSVKAGPQEDWLKRVNQLQQQITDEQAAKIAAAVPKAPVVKPLRPRRLLIFDLNIHYGGHPSIVYANLAFQMMGEKTGAYEAVIAHDISMFRPENLRQFDAVCFNNTVCFDGTMEKLFEKEGLKKSLLEFVYAGGGIMGIHGAAANFLRWDEYGRMLGAYLDSHPWNKETVTIKPDDPEHPLNAVFGGEGFQLTDEIFQFHAPYSRDWLRILLSLDTARTNMDKPDIHRDDSDFAVSWVRNYGRGRVFYCSLGHSPHIFWNPKLLRHYLAAIQFILGDLPAPATPSNELTPAIRAREKMGWRFGTTVYSFKQVPFFEAVDMTAALGLHYIQSICFLPISTDIPKTFDHNLSDEILAKIRAKLESAGVRLISHYIGAIPGDEVECRKVFEFGRKMGLEAFVSEPDPNALDTIERFCKEYDIKVGIHNHGPEHSRYWHPSKILEVCQGRSNYIGAAGDMGYWQRAGIRPLDAVRMLGDRIVTLEAHDLVDGHDVPWGTGTSDFAQVIREIHNQGVKPVMFTLEYSYKWGNNLPEMAECARFFDILTLQPADGR